MACLLVVLTAGAAVPARTEPVARWTFDGSPPGASSVAGAPDARVEGARQVKGMEGRAMSFQDWSVVDYLKPDPRKATRVTVPHDPRLNPPLPFRVTARIFPTADPIYFGGIVEKGRGFGSSYRLLLLRGLRVEASFGGRHLTARSASPIALDSWHEVTLAADREALRLIVDGEEVARTSLGDASPLTGAQPLLIGDRFTGLIDEISIDRP